MIVSDRLFFPSIKDNEHLLRVRVQDNKCCINGREQKRPSNFAKEMKNIYFEDRFIKFVYARNFICPILSEKQYMSIMINVISLK